MPIPFQLSGAESESLMPQFVNSRTGRGGCTYMPRVTGFAILLSLAALRLFSQASPGTQSPQPGQTEVNPMDGLTYIWIPAGTFVMGCSPGDSECDRDEKPPHQVTITRPFRIGQTPVTQEAYQRV